ncbi:VQ motif-containing protein 9 [Linum perenne]
MERQSLIDSYNNNERDQYLKYLNKQSQKISKPGFSSTANSRKPSPSPFYKQQQSNSNPLNQPMVCKTNKNDFQDVVQRLTKSPAQDRFSSNPPTPPPAKTTKPPPC